MKITKFILFFIGISASLSSAALGDSFVQQKMDAALQTPTPLTSDQLAKVQTVQYIFVDGIFGDILKKNFPQAVEDLDGWNASDHVIIRPDTANAVSTNAEILYGQISKIRAASTHSEAVLTAHSKGSAEVLLMALRHPDVITQMGIKTINLVSGPHEGTNLIEYFNQCFVLDFVCKNLNTLMPSLVSLTPEAMIPADLTALKALDSATQQEVAKHLFYVETLMADNDLTSPLLLSHFYLNSQGFPQNDGLIPTANEVFTPNGQLFGTDLGVMKGDHNSLLSEAITDDTKTYRHTFFQVLLESTLLK
jgi:hypothetical protein